jgi:pimeloyl-ACP methyl ester carboxylesterase
MAEVTVGGIRLVYEIHSEGPPVVLVCGTGQPAALWTMFGTVGNVTEQGYQVVTFDNRGIPPSDVPPPPYTVEETAADAIGLLEHVGTGPYVLMGASLGGLITQTVALKRPDLVRAAVFLVGCGNISPYARAEMRGLDALFAMADPPKDLLTALSLATFVPPPKWADEAAVAAAVNLVGMFTASSMEGFAGQLQADAKWASENHLDELASLEIPALAIAHQYDTTFPPACVSEAVSRMKHGEYFEVPDAAHVALDPAQAELAGAALRDFLRRHAPVASAV